MRFLLETRGNNRWTSNFQFDFIIIHNFTHFLIATFSKSEVKKKFLTGNIFNTAIIVKNNTTLYDLLRDFTLLMSLKV